MDANAPLRVVRIGVRKEKEKEKEKEEKENPAGVWQWRCLHLRGSA